jgi:uncharacterized membrane protein
MNKRMFLNQLKKELKYYKKVDTEEIIYYYDEMIQDAIDAGENEVIFIKNLGSLDEIVSNVVNDGEFMMAVKASNSQSLTNIISGTVRIISFFIYIVSLFVIGVVSVSIIIAGFAMVIQSGVYLILDDLTSLDQWILIGVILMGIGIGMIGVALFNNLLKTSQSIKLYVTRKTKQLFRKKEVNDYE